MISKGHNVAMFYADVVKNVIVRHPQPTAVCGLECVGRDSPRVCTCARSRKLS